MVQNGPQTSKEEIAATGQVLARPTQPIVAGEVGLHPLGLDGKRDGFFYVPKSYRPEQPAPLVLMLHGAGGSAEVGLQPFQHLADQSGIILLAIDSRYKTWDMIISHYGPDIAFMDRALAEMFSRYAIDPSRVAIGGFSDGASYALSVGISKATCLRTSLPFHQGSCGLQDVKEHHACLSPTANGILCSRLTDAAVGSYLSCSRQDTMCITKSLMELTPFLVRSPAKL